MRFWFFLVNLKHIAWPEKSEVQVNGSFELILFIEPKTDRVSSVAQFMNKWLIWADCF